MQKKRGPLFCTGVNTGLTHRFSVWSHRNWKSVSRTGFLGEKVSLRVFRRGVNIENEVPKQMALECVVRNASHIMIISNILNSKECVALSIQNCPWAILSCSMPKLQPIKTTYILYKHAKMALDSFLLLKTLSPYNPVHIISIVT